MRYTANRWIATLLAGLAAGVATSMAGASTAQAEAGFRYSKLRVRLPLLQAQGPAPAGAVDGYRVRVTVTNTGRRLGWAVPELYLVGGACRDTIMVGSSSRSLPLRARVAQGGPLSPAPG